MSQVLVTVVIPAHNAERYLGAALESVLAQTHSSLEVIVVDDGSEDGTAAVAHGFGRNVVCLTQGQSGAGAARNTGVAHAHGDYVAFLDADDLWRPSKLELQLAAFDEPGAPDLVFGLVDEFVSPDLSASEAARLLPRPGLLPGHLASALLARREVFELVGPIATTLRVGEFVDWIARAEDAGCRRITVPFHVASRRLHGENVTLRERGAIGDLPLALKAMLDRRRAMSAA